MARQLENAIRSSFESFENSCRTMFEQMDTSRALVENSDAGTSVGPSHDKTGFLEKLVSLRQYVEETHPIAKLMKFLEEDKVEEGFHMALSAGDVDLVAWLCNQIDPTVVFERQPLPLGQGILLSLVQQLGVEIEKDTKSKLRWIQECLLSLDPNDPTVAGHVPGILEEVLTNLHRQATIAGPRDLADQMRLVTHVLKSMLAACK